MYLEIPASPEVLVATVATSMIERLGSSRAVSLSLKAIATMRDKADAEGLSLWLDLHAMVALQAAPKTLKRPSKTRLLH